MENYTFEMFEKDLDNGFQIYLTFVKNRYLIYKTNHNCYTQELVEWTYKSAQAKTAIITHKRLEEIFMSATDLEYKH